MKKEITHSNTGKESGPNLDTVNRADYHTVMNFGYFTGV